MDVVSAAKRSWVMSRVRDKDTVPELKVRSLVHRLGYRYRLHRKDLPGRPDLVFVSRRKIININGCFWHGHDCSRGKRVPKTNSLYWKEKIEKNRKRDKRNQEELESLGWEVLVVWECQMMNEEALCQSLQTFLD